MSDIRQVVHQIVDNLRKANQLINLENLEEHSLWLHVALDKGGKSTKMILQVINQKNRHSIDYAKLIGYFEGKDNRSNLEEIFGPLFTALEEYARDIASLQLVRPQPEQSPVCHCQDHSHCDGE